MKTSANGVSSYINILMPNETQWLRKASCYFEKRNQWQYLNIGESWYRRSNEN
jgi:hypothetical protein